MFNTQQKKELLYKQREIELVSNLIVEGSYDYLVRLFENHPKFEYADYHNAQFRKADVMTYLLLTVDRLYNSEMKKELVKALKNIEIYNSKNSNMDIDHLYGLAKFLADEVSSNVFGECELVKKYIPNLDTYLFNFIIERTVNNRSGHVLYITESLFNETLDNIQDIYLLDLYRQNKLFVSVAKLNRLLENKGINISINKDDLDRLINNNYMNNLSQINSYLIAKQIYGMYLKNPYKANSVMEELHTTHEYDFKDVVNKLSINYSK